MANERETPISRFIETASFSSPMVKKAFEFGQKAHEGQFRKTGEPYFEHCIATAAIIASWGIDDELILSSALLHDALEDTKLSFQEIEANFGREVAFLVGGVTKLRSESEKRDSKGTLKKVLKNSYMDPRVAVIKMADRLHNMQTLDALSPEKQREKSEETLNVYAKLAESLGMWLIKNQLEDLAFKYLQPEYYKKVKDEIDNDPRRSPEFVAFLKTHIEQLLFEHETEGLVQVRNNGYYNLVRKREKVSLEGKSSADTFKDINDLTSFRIVLPDLKSCYMFLGILHEYFDNMVDFDRFDEFVGANTRINGYSAIQTTINFPAGSVEIALVSSEMEDFNNWGVVTLIRAKENDLRPYTLKTVFTPSGHVVFLPKEATGIDFAYAVNPRLGADAEFLIVDGENRPLSTVIPNSSTVEVVFSEHRRAPNKDLRQYSLKSTVKIMEEQMKMKDRDDLIAKGKLFAEEILSQRGILDLETVLDKIRPLLYRLGCQGLDDLYFKIGSGSLSKNKLEEELELSGITKEKLQITSLEVEGIDQPGILSTISQIIEQLQGNIINIGFTRNNKRFLIRIFIENFDKEKEERLKQELLEDKRFEKVKVV